MSPDGRLTRRAWLLGATALPFATGVYGQAPEFANAALRDRVLGMLLGSAIGDAAGGPVEFQTPESTRDQLPDGRHWSEDRRLSLAAIRELATKLKLLPYDPWRPEPEPYGQWTAHALPGTVTDDTRHKMVVMAAVLGARQAGTQLDRARLAHAYAHLESLSAFDRPEYVALRREGFREYRLAAQHVLGQGGLPAERIWGGLPTCCGQMALAPLAALAAGQPERAYALAYEVAFFDQGIAKDLNAAVVAGLARGLTLPAASPAEAFAGMRACMLATDPHRYRDIPFIERPIARVLRSAEGCVEEAAGHPGRLYDRLQSAFHPQYFWEADYTLGAAWALLQACAWNGLAAMHLAMDMGHDTDSVAQLIGQFWGAIVGGGRVSQSVANPRGIKVGG